MQPYFPHSWLGCYSWHSPCAKLYKLQIIPEGTDQAQFSLHVRILSSLRNKYKSEEYLNGKRSLYEEKNKIK